MSNGQRVPGNREREIFRLRVVEGLTLAEIAGQVGGMGSERVRQLLNLYFHLKGTPPAVRLRARTGSASRVHERHPTTDI